MIPKHIANLPIIVQNYPISLFFEIYHDYIRHFPQHKRIQEVARDGVFMYRREHSQKELEPLLKEWFSYAQFTSRILRQLHFPSFYVYRCMHHIKRKTIIKQMLPFSTTWNWDIAVDWYTPESTILIFDIRHLLVTYIPSGEDEIMIEPSFIIKHRHIKNKLYDIYLCMCVPTHTVLHTLDT